SSARAHRYRRNTRDEPFLLSMATDREKREHLEEGTHDEGSDLENLTIKYSAYSACLLLLSGVQIYFLGEKEAEKEVEKEKCTSKKGRGYLKGKKEEYNSVYSTLKNEFLNDYALFCKEPKRALLKEETSYTIPFYRNK
ncbi:conserved Plasmodium protein, unknown function, partial [Plasmodium ovale curtisi]